MGLREKKENLWACSFIPLPRAPRVESVRNRRNKLASLTAGSPEGTQTGRGAQTGGMPALGSSTVVPAVGGLVPKMQRGVSTGRDHHEAREGSYNGTSLAPKADGSTFHPTLPCAPVCLQLRT